MSPDGQNPDGCPEPPRDDDGDGVSNDADACPSTPEGEAVNGIGCGPSQRDSDRDGIDNAADQCPGTPAGEGVNGVGCSASQRDGDRDGVSDAADLCPATPAGAAVDATGCSASQRDEDGDGVEDSVDQCPATPAGESVDDVGCSASQLDEDEDGVDDGTDQCPATPAGEAVDAVGCGASQLDSDGDGVDDATDQCPATPEGEAVDAVGCAASQLDADGDGVDDATDQCPATSDGEPVDADGCSAAQLDSDGDGVADAADQCPGTSPSLPAGPDGCSALQAFGDDLANLAGLTGSQRRLASRVDDICPRLIVDEADLTPAQRRLRDACSNLKDRETTDEQARDALSRILPEELPAYRDYAVELAAVEFRQLDSRRRTRNAGRGGGVSVSGLNFRAGDRQVSGGAIEQALGDLLGMAAGEGEGSFSDFGRLGLFLQGDIDFAERDRAPSLAGYEFDIWSVTGGADYRISDRLFAGLAASFGKAEVDFAGERGRTDVDNLSLSVYAGWQITEAWYADFLVSYGGSDYDSVRNLSYVDAGGLYEATHLSETDGDRVSMGVNSGYEWTGRGWRFGPTVSVFYVDGSIDGFSERAGVASDDAWLMQVGRQDFESLRLSLGFQADYAWTTSFGVLLPNLRARYVRESEDGSQDLGLRLLNNPYDDAELQSDPLRLDGVEVDDQFFDLGLGVSGQFPMGFSGFVDYHFYEGFNGFSRDGYSFGVRWDKPF
jgi:outer membrane autotransporter protein